MKVPCRSLTLGPLVDIQGMSPGRRVPVGKEHRAESIKQRETINKEQAKSNEQRAKRSASYTTTGR